MAPELLIAELDLVCDGCGMSRSPPRPQSESKVFSHRHCKNQTWTFFGGQKMVLQQGQDIHKADGMLCRWAWTYVLSSD